MDSILIIPPGPSVAGSQLQIGTYLMADPGADYGAQGLIQSIESTNALRDGGAFAYRSVGPRKMSFPLLLRDVPGQTLLQTESLLREWTTAGAAVAVQPEQIPSGQAVFFDVLDGRWEPAYDTFENRAGRRKGTLFLDTQPWGYWPTEILLASAASIGLFGQMPVNGASVIGDVPPLAHLTISPTAASVYSGFGVWQIDMAAYSLGGRPSFVPLIGASSLFGQAGLSPSLLGDKYAPASQAIYYRVAAADSWVRLCDTATFISSALEPAYRGRFRVFGFAKTTPSSPPWQVIVDADRYNTNLYPAMASTNQLATAYNVIPGLTGGSVFMASPMYDTLDLGEITLPAGGSGVQQGARLRVWVSNPSSAGASGVVMQFGGLFLLPVDGAAGVLTRGLVVPTIGPFAAVGTVAALDLNKNFVDSVNLLTASNISGDGRSQFRGVSPRIGASTNQLTLLTGDRWSGNLGVSTYAVAQAQVEYSQVSVSYRPTFQFLAGL